MDMLMNLIEEKFKVFGFGKIQDFVTMLDIMKKYGISEDNIRNYVKEKIQEIKAKDKKIRDGSRKFQEIWQKKAKRCPHCDIPMRLTPGDSNDSMWTCMKCRHGAYDSRNPQEIIKEMGL